MDGSTFKPGDPLTPLLDFFNVRRLGACPYCECRVAWINERECSEHIMACLRIRQGLEIEAHRKRKAEKVTT